LDLNFRILSKERFKELNESENLLLCLQNAGVDNWEWYDVAMEEYRDVVED